MIELKSVTKEYPLDHETSVTPVRNIELRVERGEFLMIVGRSGSGKTTLLNLCAGLVKPTAGQVLVDGQDIQSLDERGLSELRSKKMGFVFQSASMLPSLSVIENVAVPTLFSGSGSAEDRFQRAAEVLELVGLGERMDVLPRQLSGGEVRRVAIARALMNRPEILLADEPTSDLDVQTELRIVAALQRIHETGVTVMMVTHSLELVPYATRALRMEEGRLVPFEGTPAQSLPVCLEAPSAAPSFLRRAGHRTDGLWALLRRPAAWGYLGLTLALLAMTLAFGVTLGKVGTTPPATPPGPTSAPGPVLPENNGMSMGGGTGQYNPTQYNLYGNTGMYSSAMMGVTWPVQVDPPPGEPFKDPSELENLSSTTGVFEGRLEAQRSPVELNGVEANLLTYNGLYPGPVIKVRRGDLLRIAFTNSLPATTEMNVLGYEKNHTNLHAHGLHVSPEEPGDNVMLDLAPGESYSYEYDLALQEGGTLNFIHGHVHGLAAEQLWGGMLATILVADEIPVLAGYESHVMVLKDITLDGEEPQAHLFMSDYMFGKEGTLVTVNGQVNPVLSIRPGQVQRWHILNGSNARFYRVYLENHLLYLVGTDGGLLDKPYPISSLLLAPGERADVLVKGSATTGNYRLISLPYSRQMGMMGMGAGMGGMSMSGQTAGLGGGWTGLGMGVSGSGMGMYGSGVYGGGAYSPYLYDPATGMYRGSMGGGGMYDGAVYATWPAVTGLLGLTTAEIQTRLAQGSSLVEVAATREITQGELVQAILAQISTNLEPSVQAGYLTEQELEMQRAWMEPLVLQAVTVQGIAAPVLGMGMGSGMYNQYPYYAGLGYGGTSGGSCGGMGTSGMGSVGAMGMCPGMIGTMGMGMYDMSASTQVTLMTLVTNGSAVDDALPTAIDPAATRLAVDIAALPQRVLVLGMDMGNAYINGWDYDVQPFTIPSRVGTYEVWQIVNQTGMDHPFHAHVNPFQVLSISGGDADYGRLYMTTPAWKDVVIVPRMGSATLLMPVRDYTGMTMFHCHILEHEDIGMMGVWEIAGEGMEMP